MTTLLSQIVSNFSTSLSAKVAASDETATIVNYTDDDGVTLPAGKYYFTIDGDNAQREHIYCTLSTSTLSSIKSVSVQGVQTTGFAREHRVGASVTLTDHAIIREMVNLLSGEVGLNASSPLSYDADPTLTDDKNLATKKYADGLNATAVHLTGDESVAGVKTFTSIPVLPASNPTTDNQAVRKAYADGLAISGSPDATIAIKGIGRYATAAEIIAGSEVSATDGTPLNVNPKYLKDAGFAPYSTITADTLIPMPNAIVNYATTTYATIDTSTNTVLHLGQIVVPFQITVNKIETAGATVGGTGAVKIVIYSEDGGTLLLEQAATIANGGMTVTTLSAPLLLSAGIYYLGILGLTGGTVSSIYTWATLGDGTNWLNTSTGKPVMSGTLTVTADTVPATIDPTAITGTINNTLMVRLDN